MRNKSIRLIKIIIKFETNKYEVLRISRAKNIGNGLKQINIIICDLFWPGYI